MDDVVISWSLQNWITVLLMVAVFFVIVVLLTKVIKGVASQAASPNS